MRIESIEKFQCECANTFRGLPCNVCSPVIRGIFKQRCLRAGPITHGRKVSKTLKIEVR